ncbi:GH92 family glycosyl hydrolase [Sphingomonas oryzagri]|uniref:GH92 family glycosyl hydrolase n=1 Tax=Sphingomonas oryzagri TaxID=3042314 RepID=A0ABT6N6H7_9SPHN|nr:GH92 family glycosyl hydrolase [Sphingomonas oryzagri]MDH7640724.1 GH92 family glycosyl hydrolase [Sphingomonas oryzagri]
MKRGCWAMLATAAITAPLLAAPPADPAALVNPFIGTTNGGNEFPGAVLPFGMVSFSPEETPLPGSGLVVAAPGGYEWRSNGVRGFGLAHVSGSGCAGAGGDIPIMPVTRAVETSPSAPGGGNLYAAYLDHGKEQASPGAYAAKLGNGVAVDLSATLRTGVARFAFPDDKPANLLFRTSDTEVGSSDATIHIDAAHRTVSGTVTSGNFCGYLSPDRRQSYYTLHFVAVFDRDFKVGGTWTDGEVHAGATDAKGGTGYGNDGFPVPGKGSGGWISFDAGAPVTMRVGISYVDDAGARANLTRESPAGTGLDATRTAARAAWNRELGRIAIEGGTDDERTVFTTALYHSLIDPSIASDVDGRYRGMDGTIHHLADRQQAQYANFSGWDVYRSQLQLVTMLEPKVGSDIAQSLLNQADQNGGVWDRWTHMTGATGVMNGDPSAPAIAAIYAFGGRDFDVRRAYASLLKAATVPNAKDLSRTGCPVLCVGQRPGLDQWLSLHYMPAGAPGWGSVSDTLEMAAADFGLAQLAGMLGDKANERRFLDRAGWWRNLVHPTSGYIQPRRPDGSWLPFDPASDDEFVEGSGAQYRWMVPFDPAGLFAAIGGRDRAMAALDGFFHDDKGDWAVTKSGPLHAELDNEPSIASPWLYNFAGAPWKTQGAVREAMRRIWTNRPNGISGNDDLGEMSSWYVWSAMGLYPLYPGRTDLVVGSPLFRDIRIDRPGGAIHIVGDGAAGDAPYVHALTVNGRATTRPWIAPDQLKRGGELRFTLSADPDKGWGAAPADAPPSYPPLGSATRR